MNQAVQAETIVPFKRYRFAWGQSVTEPGKLDTGYWNAIPLFPPFMS